MGAPASEGSARTQHPEPASQRLFIALWPPASVRDAIAAWQQQWRLPDRARVVTPAKLHLTLHFLGDIATSRMPVLREALRVPSPPFDLELGEADLWSGIAVCRPRSVPDALTRLHADLAQRLAALSIPLEERRYTPHVTLARRAFGAAAPATPLALRWHAAEGHVLVRTAPGDGSYEIVERYPP